MTERFKILAYPKDVMPTSSVPSGTAWCSVCAVEMWVSMSLLPAIASGQADPVCTDCGSGLIAGSEDVEFSILPEQEPELRDLGALGHSRALIDALNRKGKKPWS